MRHLKNICKALGCIATLLSLIFSIVALCLAIDAAEQGEILQDNVKDIRDATGQIRGDAASIKGLVESVEPQVSELRSVTGALSELYSSATFPTIDDLYSSISEKLRVARISHASRYDTASLIARLLINDYRRENLHLSSDRNSTPATPRSATFVSVEQGSDDSGHLADGIVASALSHDPNSPGTFSPLLLSSGDELPRSVDELLTQYWVELVEFRVVGSDPTRDKDGSLSDAGGTAQKLMKLLDKMPAASSVDVYGDDRYETALEAYDVLTEGGKMSPGPICGDDRSRGESVAIIAPGASRYLAAALPALPLSAIGRTPILLYEAESDIETDSPLLPALKASGVTDVILLGSTDAIPTDFADELEKININYWRIPGKTRYETSVEFAKFALGIDASWPRETPTCLDSRTVAFVNSEVPQEGERDSAGGVTIAPLLAKERGLMFLIESRGIPDTVCEFFEDHAETMDIENVWIVGGTARIKSKVAEDIIYMVENQQCR